MTSGNRTADSSLSPNAHEIAPDGAEVRLLSAVPRGSMAHFTIPVGQTIRAVRHKTVDEIWFVLSGSGQMCRSGASGDGMVEFSAGMSLVIPVGTAFQVKNSGADDIEVLGQTMPAWPGNDEAEIVSGPWSPTLVRV